MAAPPSSPPPSNDPGNSFGPTLPSIDSMMRFENIKPYTNDSEADWTAKRPTNLPREPSVNWQSDNVPVRSQVLPLGQNEERRPTYAPPVTSTSTLPRLDSFHLSHQSSNIQRPMDNHFFMQTARRSLYSAGENIQANPSVQHLAQAPPRTPISNPLERAKCLGKKEIAGKLCWYYSDGTTMPTEIDGQPVDPELGVTKNFKARRRQAHACQYCREKKTRCEVDRANPHRPCQACAKHGRECQWFIGGKPSLDLRTSEARKRAAAPVKREDKAEDRNKRVKGEPISIKNGKDPSRSPASDARAPSETDSQRYFSPQTMPLLELYIKLRDTHCTKVFPTRAFLSWVSTEADKSTEELMMLNACLAVASLYSDDEELRKAGQEAYEMAQKVEQARTADFSLQLAQTRILFALYHWAIGRPNHCFEYTSLACRTLNALQYNTERGITENISEDPASNDYGFTAGELVECRRRTFWLAYVTERFNGYSSGNMGLLQDQDIFIRVPGLERDYDNGNPASGSWFGEEDFRNSGEMAIFVSIMSIFGEVCAYIFRNTYHDDVNYGANYEAFYTSMANRLTILDAKLPPHFAASLDCSTRAVQEERFAAYYLIRACLTATWLKLNRYARFARLSKDKIARNVVSARSHAYRFLEMVQAVLELRPRTEDFQNAIKQPVPGWINLVACDVVSCGGVKSASLPILGLLGKSHIMLDELAQSYKGGAYQQRLIRSRISELNKRSTEACGAFQWRLREPMDRSYIPADQDILYSISDEIFYGVVEEG